MVPFDLDTRVEEVEEAVCPQIASKFLCTPGRPTGGIARFTTQCTNVCSISVGFKQGLRVKMCVWLGVSRGLDLAFLNAD